CRSGSYRRSACRVFSTTGLLLALADTRVSVFVRGRCRNLCAGKGHSENQHNQSTRGNNSRSGHIDWHIMLAQVNQSALCPISLLRRVSGIKTRQAAWLLGIVASHHCRRDPSNYTEKLERIPPLHTTIDWFGNNIDRRYL